jgi:hypothetical protein
MNIKLAIKARQSLVKIRSCKSFEHITSFHETKSNFVHFYGHNKLGMKVSLKIQTRVHT